MEQKYPVVFFWLGPNVSFSFLFSPPLYEKIIVSLQILSTCSDNL